MNDRIWFIIIEKRQEGPYSLQELKKDDRFTPDTLVWKEGFSEWVPARFIPELQEIFKDAPESHPLHEPVQEKSLKPDGEATLTLQQDPYQFYLWILIIIAVFIYLMYKIN